MKLSRKHRQVLAILAVTTALCADRATAAAPAFGPHASQIAGRIVNRLTQSFGRTVAAASQVLPRQRALSGRTTPASPAARAVVALQLHRPLSPFQFRLPPPTL